AGASAEIEWLKAHAAGNPLITDHIIPRAMRRLVTTGQTDLLDACVQFAAAAEDGAVRRRALEGLAGALKGRTVDMPPAGASAQATLLADNDPQVQRLARALAVSFRDPAAVKRALAVVN